MDGRREPVRPTIKDVAAAAGVAPSTVSRAFSRPGRVTSETAERIFRVAGELGYRQDAVGHPGPRRATNLVAMCVADVMNPVFSAMTKGVYAGMAERSYGVVLVDANESAQVEARSLDRVIGSVDGLVFAGSRMSDASLRHLAGTLPAIVLSRRVTGVSSVTPDTAAGMRAAVDHLVGLGHLDICYLAGPAASWEDGTRWRAVADHCRVTPGVRLHRQGPFEPMLAGGRQAFLAWSHRPTSAVLAYNDLMAIGFMRAAMAQGVHIPADVSVIGFDDIPFAGLVEPALTTVRVNQFQLGVAGARALLAVLRRRGPHRDEVHALTVPTDLAVRASTGPAGGLTRATWGQSVATPRPGGEGLRCSSGE